MTDQVNELISALIDGEASEIETHRLLRQMKQSDAHREIWVTYQETRRVLRSGSRNGASGLHLNRQQHLELHQRISKAIAEDEVHASSQNDSRKAASVWYKPAAGLAIAASLVVAVFVGLQPQTTDVASQTSQPVSSPSGQLPPIAAQPVRNEIAKEDSGPVIEPELKELDAEGQKLLRAYLNQHDAMARMRQDTQFVNYSKPRDK